MQFDVYPNPSARARTAYPYLVVLQSDRAETGVDRVVAGLVSAAQCPTTGRLAPVVNIGGRTFVVLLASITHLPARDLRRAIANLDAHSSAIKRGFDWLLFGV